MQKCFSSWDLNTTFQRRESREISLECFPFSLAEVVAVKQIEMVRAVSFLQVFVFALEGGSPAS